MLSINSLSNRKVLILILYVQDRSPLHSQCVPRTQKHKTSSGGLPNPHKFYKEVSQHVEIKDLFP